MIKKIFLLLAILTVGYQLTAQIEKPISWQFSTSKPNAKAGETVDLIFKATIKKGWHLYSNDYYIDPGPLMTTVDFKKTGDFELIGSLKAIGDIRKYDDIFEGYVKYFDGTGLFKQKVKLLKDNAKIEGAYDGQVCTDSDGRCVPISGPFTFEFKSGEATTAPIKEEKKTLDETKATTSAEVTPDSSNIAKAIAAENRPLKSDTLSVSASTSNPANAGDTSLWAFFIQAFLGGLIALLTPCVYPIIPMTVSFFTKQKKGITLALLYGFFIVAIYVLFGTLISFLFGQTAPNFISTHWLPNILFFLVFVIFGLSFLGWFEIVLPNSVINKMDANADKGGIAGVFFMAFTLVLVSFSCTGPIAGTILGLGAQGQVIKPVIGMLGFSLAFAIPFTLFAIFPSWLHSLPKSGGWLNTVKVVLGFLELALALKFLSTADQVYHWHILDREIFLALWVAIFGLLGLYLIGKISLPHDSKTEHISVPRILFAIVAFAFTAYLVPGLWGAPLKGLSGWLPPLTTFESFGATATSSNQDSSNQNSKVKYGKLFKLPHGLPGYFDYQEALAYAKSVNKPLFIDFTGHGCVNCRKMEENVWVDPKVLQKLKNDYVILALYVDDKTEKPEAEWFTSKSDGTVKKSIGAQNLDFEITKFNGNAQPYYCLVDSKTEQLIKPPLGYDLDVDNFLGFLE
jgi:thiol:disulfide interchange protein